MAPPTRRTFRQISNDSRSSPHPSTFASPSCSKHLSIQEIEAFVPAFEPGKDGSPLAREWINKVDNLITLYRLEPERALTTAVIRLKGPAKDWFEGMQTRITSYEQFKAELLKCYPEKLTTTEVHKLLQNRKRGSGETIDEYFMSIVKHARRIDLDDNSIKEYLIHGIPDPMMRGLLTKAESCSIPDFLVYMKEVEKNIKDSSPKPKENNPETSSAKSKRHFSGQNRKFWGRKRKFGDKKDDDEKPDTDTAPKKEKMAKKDETSSKFSKTGKRRCYACDSEEHLIRDCPKKKKKQDFPIGVLSKPSTQTNKGFVKEAKVGLETCAAMIDLGSEVTLIRKSLAQKLKWAGDGECKRFSGFGGGICESLGSMEIDISIDKFKRHFKIYVVPDEVLRYPMLCGNDFFSTPDVKLIKTFDSLIIRKVPKTNAPEVMVVSPNTEKRVIQMSDLKIGENVAESDKRKLLDLLNKYRDCFALNSKELGHTTLNPMKLTMKTQEVVRYRPYSVSSSQKETLKKIVKELLDEEIIEESNSEFSSPVVLVSKPTGESRLCVDYRRVNKICQQEVFPLPKIEEELDKLAGKSCFTSLDLRSGYYQLEVEPESRKYTSFVIPGGQYQFKRVPYGLTNSPSVFVRVMNQVMRPLLEEGISFYVDDIMIPTVTVDENFRVLERTLQELQKAGLTLNVSKCDFFMEKVKYLGYNVSQDGITLSDLKTEVIEKFPSPTTLKSLREFLGLSGYFRRFVPAYSKIARPLYNLLKKDKTFEWGHEEEKSFQLLKTLLTQQPLLTLFDPTLTHELHTDGSSFGLGAVLMQVDEKEVARPVAYYSRVTTPAESRYSSFELETLALVEALKRFRYYLLGRTFKVYTDCNSLKQAHVKRDMSPKMARWWYQIQEFDFELHFRNGTRMRHADFLSRNPLTANQEVNKEVLLVLNNFDWVASLQTQDGDLVQIKKVLDGVYEDHEDKENIHKTYELKGERLFRKTDEGLKFCVPRGMRFNIMHQCHDRTGHPAFQRTLENISKDFYWPRMRSMIKKYVDGCISCCQSKRGVDETRVELHTIDKSPVPFRVIHMDHSGPYPRAKGSCDHVLIVVDAFTKYTILRPVKSANTAGVIKVMEEISQLFGYPSVIVSDRGTAFTSKAFEEYCRDREIKLALVAAKTPRGNGQAERCFRVVGDSLKAMSENEDGKDWYKNLPTVQWYMNSSKNRITGHSPQELLFGFRPRNVLGNLLANAIMEDTCNDSNISVADLREATAKRVQQLESKQAKKHNDEHLKPHKYKEGDLVLVRWDAPATGSSRKMSHRFRGPYVVKKDLGRDRYEVTDTLTTQLTNKPFHSVYAADKMKPWGDRSVLEMEEYEVGSEQADSK